MIMTFICFIIPTVHHCTVHIYEPVLNHLSHPSVGLKKEETIQVRKYEMQTKVISMCNATYVVQIRFNQESYLHCTLFSPDIDVDQSPFQ